MRKLIVLTFISLDGVMQAPGGKGEDPSGDFEYEGWTVPYFDEFSATAMGKQMTPPFDLLLGKKTYDIFAGYWPQQTGETAKLLNNARKYVVTHQSFEPGWEGTTVISSDIVGSLKELKCADGPPLQVHGSSNLAQTLLAHDLIDELWLKIFPITLGKGKRLFGEGTIPAAFTLTESVVSPSGVIFASYQRAGDVQTGSF